MAFESEGSQKFQILIEEEEDLMWRKADLLAEIRRTEGDDAVRAIARDHRLTPAYLVAMARVAEGIRSEARDSKLSFSHHRACWLTGEWEKWLAIASDNDMSLRELRDAILRAHGIDPNTAARRAAQASRQIKTAADDADGTPALSEVVIHAESAYNYVRMKNDSN